MIAVRLRPDCCVGRVCSDLPCMFVSEKSTRLAAIIYIMFLLHPPGGTTSLPVLKELVLSLKMGYWILSSPNMLHWIIANTGMDPCIQEQGLCTAFTVTSLGNLEVQSPCTVRTLEKINNWEAIGAWCFHSTNRCIRAFRWHYPDLDLRVRVMDMGLPPNTSLWSNETCSY